jgi:cyclophilin family peptidyl-prolyl cis-trans isomerase
MRTTTRVACFLVLLVAASPGVGDGPADARLPVPDAAARGPVAAELKKELGDKLKTKDLESKRSLARTLIERAAAPDADAVKRYVLLDAAEGLAEEARDVHLALDVVGKIAGAYQTPLATRGLAAVDAVTRGAKETSASADAAGACVELAGDALAADDPNGAGKALAAAKSYAKTAKLGGLVARATELETFVPAYRKLSAAAGVGLAALDIDAADPGGNEAVGRFECFGRGRWNEGLPHLAKSGNTALAAVAANDLDGVAHPKDVAAAQALCDSWWDLAQKEKEPLARARMLARAASGYDVAKSPTAKERVDSVTYLAWNRGVALTKDFSKDGPVSLALATIREFIAQQHVDKKSDAWKTKVPRFPDVTFGRGEEYLWRLDTNQGVITMRLFADTAPKHVANFIYLTELGFYDDSIFHRVIPGFMAQGGSSSKTASTGPGYTFSTEFIGDRKHDKAGVLSMANTGQPNSDASQFFITFVATPNLDGKHTICGEVIEGMDAVRKLEEQGTPDAGVPKTPLVIRTARILVR